MVELEGNPAFLHRLMVAECLVFLGEEEKNSENLTKLELVGRLVLRVQLKELSRLWVVAEKKELVLD